MLYGSLFASLLHFHIVASSSHFVFHSRLLGDFCSARPALAGIIFDLIELVADIVGYVDKVTLQLAQLLLDRVALRLSRLHFLQLLPYLTQLFERVLAQIGLTIQNTLDFLNLRVFAQLEQARPMLLLVLVDLKL